MSFSGDSDEATAMLELRKVAARWCRNSRRPLVGNEAYLSTETIERKFNIRRSDIIKAIRDGLLTAFRGPCNRWLIHPADFETYRKQR